MSQDVTRRGRFLCPVVVWGDSMMNWKASSMGKADERDKRAPDLNSQLPCDRHGGNGRATPAENSTCTYQPQIAIFVSRSVSETAERLWARATLRRRSQGSQTSPHVFISTIPLVNLSMTSAESPALRQTYDLRKRRRTRLRESRARSFGLHTASTTRAWSSASSLYTLC